MYLRNSNVAFPEFYKYFELCKKVHMSSLLDVHIYISFLLFCSLSGYLLGDLRKS